MGYLVSRFSKLVWQHFIFNIKLITPINEYSCKSRDRGRDNFLIMLVAAPKGHCWKPNRFFCCKSQPNPFNQWTDYSSRNRAHLFPHASIPRYYSYLEDFFRWLRIKRYFDGVVSDGTQRLILWWCRIWWHTEISLYGVVSDGTQRFPFRVKIPPEGQDNGLDTFIKTVKLTRNPKTAWG